MAYNKIIVTVQEGIAIITINRPHVMNALNAETIRELSDAIDRIGTDRNVQVVIITGAGKKSFVAGADIMESITLDVRSSRKVAKNVQSLFDRLENLPQPVIAAINGYALGGGCELACACDIRYASDNARFGQPEVGLGITPSFGGTQRLPRVVGSGYGKELIYSGSIIDAQEAYRIGLVNKVVPQEELMDEVLKLAKRIRKNAPIAVQLAKAAMNRGMNCDVTTGIAYEAEVFGLCFATADQKEGMQAFVEKRKAVFSGK